MPGRYSDAIAPFASPLLLACLACIPTEPIPASDERLLVEGVLNAGTNSQIVTVRRIGGELGTSHEPVTGALVWIATGGALEMMASETQTAGTYSVDLSRYGKSIIGGDTYTLRIVTPAGEQVVGTTTVPIASPPPIDSDITLFSRSRDTVQAAWPRAVGAKSYYVAVSALSRYVPGYIELRYSSFSDTTIALHGTIEPFDGDPVFTPFDTVTVVAGAVDDNFYDYYHATVDPFAGSSPTRLQGAIGVFGSFVPVYRRRFAVVE